MAYLQFNMPGSDVEHHAQLLLTHLEHQDSKEAKPEGEEPGSEHRAHEEGSVLGPIEKRS